MSVDGRRTTGRRWPVLVFVAFWIYATASLVVAIVFDIRFHDIGRPDLAAPVVVAGVISAAVVSAGIVGTALAMRRPEHPVGWLFLGLAFMLATTLMLVDTYGRWGAVARPGSLPGADVAAFVSDRGFVAWFAIVGLILHLTPTGRPLSPRWRRAAIGVVATATTSFVTGLLSDLPADPPFSEVENPLALDGLGPVLEVVWQLATALTAVGLVTAAISLVVRFRRSEGTERQQLLWLSLAAAPVPVWIIVVFVASRGADNEVALVLGSGGWIVMVPIATGLCISRYHLFEVERIVSRTFTYSLLSAVLVITYASVVVLSGRALSGWADSSALSAALGTLAAVSIAAPARTYIQDSLDRRFNRRRFDALRVVERHLRDPAPGVTIEEVLRDALADPAVAVSYWVADRSQWVTADGHAVDRPPTAVQVRRDGEPVARVEAGESTLDRSIIEAVATLALPELDNARLRAAISLQLVEVNQSRARIAAAQMVERRRIERNLHDGAQQRLLALGFQLRAAELNGDPQRLREAVTTGVEQTQLAVSELRDLANGLHPAVLADGGLTAALDDLVARTPIPMRCHCPADRLPPDVEAAAWFVTCEAVANACKHADPTLVVVDVDVDIADDAVTVVVGDDGAGGADPTGSGLRGMRDRTEALGGTLEIESPPHGGTTVRARIPCAP